MKGFDFLRGKAEQRGVIAIDVQKGPVPGAPMVFKSPEETEREIGETLARSLDTRSRIERERDAVEKRLEKLNAEATELREQISRRTADLLELERVISGMEIHRDIISAEKDPSPEGGDE